VNTEEFRRHGHVVVDLLADYLEHLPQRPPWTPVLADARRALVGQHLPDTGRPFDELLRVIERDVLPYPFGNGHPRFFAWGNPPPTLEGVLADFIAAAMNPSCAGGDHAAIYLEQCTTRWIAELVGFPGQGVLVSGGADGALTALAAARHHAALRDGWDDLAEGVTNEQASWYRLYASTETHS
jgi:glutamate/tyrosine decarboxylase-like PLP-dependent enzyme